MKNKVKFLVGYLLVAGLAGCSKDDLPTPDVSFSADKSTVNKGETVTFSFGAGADALSVYPGDAGRDFEKSRLNLIELKNYSEDQLRTQLFATPIPGMKEYLTRLPRLDAIPADFKFTGAEMQLYNGMLVPWDYAKTTDSRYVRLKTQGDDPLTFSFSGKNAVVPTMLDYDNTKLRSLGAINNVANNNVVIYAAFPDGFTPQSTVGTSVRLGIQVVIDGVPTGILYLNTTVRELLNPLTFNIDPLTKTWRTANPTKDVKKGIEEVRLILNADDPTKTDDDGPLLNYNGNAYIQEIRIGSADNMIKAFDLGITVPYVYDGQTVNYKYTYTTSGTYRATMVATYVGRKQYSGDGYQTGRADEILASEYPVKRVYKTVEVKVN